MSTPRGYHALTAVLAVAALLALMLVNGATL